MLATIYPDAFVESLDAGMHAHLDWSRQILRCAILRTEPGADLLHPEAHTLSDFGSWFMANHDSFRSLDEPRAQLMRAQHKALHDAVRTLCCALRNGATGDPADFDTFETAQRALIDHLAFFKTLALSRASQMDVLTALPLRRSMEKDFDALTRCTRQRGVVGMLMMVDVDHFKAINDAYGHAGGDIVLREIARSLKHVLRGNDLVYRYGGEEFVLMMELPLTAHAELTAANRVLYAIRNLAVDIGGMTVHPTVTIGVASAHPDESLPSLIKRADEAMYAGKAAGRDCYHIV